MKYSKKLINFYLILFFLFDSIISIITDDSDEENIYLNGKFEDEIILNNINNKRFIFHINNSDFIYFFESADMNGYIHYENDKPCPNFCAIQFNQSIHENILYLNYYKNASEKNIVISISSLKDYKGEIKSIRPNDLKIDKIKPITISKSIVIVESFIDYIFYLKSFDNSISIKYSEYNKDMNKNDIININEKYFRNCNNKINDLKENKIYIFAILSEEYNKPVEMLLQPKLYIENIEIIDEETNFLYLSSEKEKYVLDFSNNQLIRSIQLSRLTIESEISIEILESNENVILNKDNLYYIFNDESSPFTGNITLKINNGKNALISFLCKFENEVEILNEKEYIDYNIKNEKVLIKFDNNNKTKFINLNVFSKSKKEFKFTMISGYAKKNYFLNSPSNQLSILEKDYSSTNILLYNDNITLEDNESFYLFLIFEKEKILDDSYQITLNKIDKYTLDDINVDLSEEKCKSAINSLIKLFEDGYIYTDIKKNPPNPEYYGATDIISELKNIKTFDRKYYDFYRDIKRILGKIKDGHLNIAALQSPNGYNLQLMTMCLPFSFHIEGKDRDDAKMYIEIYEDCFDFYNEEEKEYIKNHEGKYLKSINNTDPFDFIQNIQNEFNSFYNKHSTFTYSILIAHKISIISNPFKKEQFSNIIFEFEDNESISLDYYLVNKNSQFNDDKEFMTFYNKEILKQSKSLEIDSILDIEKKYYRMKNNLNSNINDNIDWDYSTTDGIGIQCRVDEINHVNVFKQTSFHFLGDDYKQAIEVVENCTEAFYNNSYPIIGIESVNGGGICKLSYYFQELLQVKILPTPHYSVKLSNLMKNYVEADIPVITTDPDMYERVDIKTCKRFSKFDDMEEIIDNYGNNVTHKRSQYFRVYNSSDLKNHKKRREKYFKMKNLKKPTEILIFTDFFSYSATSFFIKGLQETGAAITVGYFGNPKNNEITDASQSPSFVGDFSNSDIYSNLLDAGFMIRGVTIYESYNYTYQIENPIPREYLIHPVDERVNIFETYNDSLYDQFINEANNIFKKYNVELKCNPNNLDLLYDPHNKNECYAFENDLHAHGGYECDPETGKWSNICKPYYCDIGYYFDKYQNKCIEDICTETEEGKNEEENDQFLIIFLFVVIALVVCSIIIIIIIIFVVKYKKPERLSKMAGESETLLNSRTS